MSPTETVNLETGEVMTVDQRREATTIAVMNSRGKDLAEMTDAEFDLGLVRLKTVQLRMHRVLDTALVDGAHYGNPKDKSGRDAFKKPMLYKAGAEELRRLMKLRLTRTKPDDVIATAEYVEARVTLGVVDAAGRFLCEKAGACSSKEKRFQKFGEKGGWIYDDAREVLHVVIAMAEKRAGSLVTLEASGATAFLSNAEEMVESLEEDKPIIPWSDEEKQQCYDLAAKKSVGRKAFAKLVLDTLGRREVGTGDDVKQLLAAIEAFMPPAPKQESAA